MIIKRLYHFILPKSLVSKINNIRDRHRGIILRRNIISYYDGLPSITSEQKQVVDYLKKNKVEVFPYEFSRKYNANYEQVYNDKINGLPYVIHEGKKLYFRKDWSNKLVSEVYNSLLTEQDPDSPHLYITNDFCIDDNDAIADVGAAEGILALTHIEKVSKVYLFEPIKEWVEALEATFEPWRGKVTIIQKFVSDKNDCFYTSLDEYFRDKVLNFLKIDVEGSEIAVLDGGKNLLKQATNFKIVICTYHRKHHEKILSDQLDSFNFNFELSKGYMIFLPEIWQKGQIPAPYLRRGVLRGRK